MLTVEALEHPPVDFLADEPEGYEFYKAFQEANIDRFELGYLQARRDGVAVATAPFFYEFKQRLGRCAPYRVPVLSASQPDFELGISQAHGNFFRQVRATSTNGDG